ncbi:MULTISPECIES: hypothetical protein [unclassified Nonomuraea]|uniref:hypothetical protein n=1 Tax=unclassified Nonomuraea TaxID=2593643 RepID=UPI0033F462E1
MSRDGYSVAWEALRRQSSVVRDHRDQVAEAARTLRQAFDRDRATLGDDAYGAELAGRLPGIEKGIFASFDAYIAELDGTDEGLGTSANTYDAAEHAALSRRGREDDPYSRTI